MRALNLISPLHGSQVSPGLATLKRLSEPVKLASPPALNAIVPWPRTPTLAAPGMPMLSPATSDPAIVPDALPVPLALTSCFFDGPLGPCGPSELVPLSVSDAFAFALIEPPAPKLAKMPGTSGTCRPYGPNDADLPSDVANVFERSP